MAQTIATLDELSEGRLFIAIGAYIALHSRIHGLAPADPPGALTEWIECIRLFLTGAPVTYHGRYVQFDNISLGFKPARSSVPIYVAATSRTGLRLAGRLGDGVLLNSIASPAYTRNALDVVRDALAEAGRDASSFRVAQIVNCSVDDDESAALDAVRWEIATKLRPLAYASSIPSRLHVGEPVLKAIDIERLHAVHAEGGDAAMSAAIPESVLRGLTASGTREAVRERVEEYRAAGVETPILRPASAEQTERVLNLFATH
jgi:alkanesulfonate monooxygenase SsuD/methylene tetrahydromethanopterin reductase-like flavin-dependent oxidoreductase (luciferase family)